jgi:hypothetical protein
VAPDNAGKLVFAANDALLRGFSMSNASDPDMEEDKMCALSGQSDPFLRRIGAFATIIIIRGCFESVYCRGYGD